MYSERLMNNLYVLYSSSSSNTYLFVGNKVILVDPGLNSKEILETWLGNIGFSFNEIDYVFLTHAHADHFVSVQYLKNSEVWCSRNAEQYLLTKDRFMTASAWFNNEYFPSELNVFKEGQVFDIGSFKLEVINLPGHSSDGVGFYDKKNKILVSGDTLFQGSCGRYDLANSNKDKLRESLVKLTALEYTLLLSGHGPVYNASEIKQKQNITQILDMFF